MHTYDLNKLIQLFFPVILHQRWVCFSWDLKYNNIRVFDPACMNMSMIQRHSVYTHVADMLKRTLSSAIRVLFTGWNHDWTTASVDTFKWRFDGMRWLVTKHIKLSNASNPSKRNMCIRTCVDCGLLLNWVLLPQLESFRCPLRIFLPMIRWG